MDVPRPKDIGHCAVVGVGRMRVVLKLYRTEGSLRCLRTLKALPNAPEAPG